MAERLAKQEVEGQICLLDFTPESSLQTQDNVTNVVVLNASYPVKKKCVGRVSSFFVKY